MNKNKDIVIDLTDSFTLVDHGCMTNNIIELDSDESLNLSLDDSIEVTPKNTCNRKRKNERNINKESQHSSKKSTLRERTSSKFGDCAICWDELGTNPLASTKCGHVYCLKCLEKTIKLQKRCPTCRSRLVGKNSYHPLYLHK